MNKSLLLAAAVVSAALTLPGHALSGGDLEEYDPIPMYPVVVYDLSGSTLLGPVAKSLVVYSNGRVQISQAAGALAEPYVFADFMSQDSLQRLLIELDRWKHLKDETLQVADLPLQTLTTFDGGKTRSVSWWIGNNGHDNLEQALAGVVLQLFPHLEQ